MDVGSNADAHAALERPKKMKRPALLISVAILGLILFSISLPAFASWKKERRALNRVPRNFVVCLQLDETSPLQSENGREFFMKLSFEKVRNWRTLGTHLYSVHGLWQRNRENAAPRDLVTLFEGTAAITPDPFGDAESLEVSIESHEISVRNPDAFHQTAFHLLMDPHTFEGEWAAKTEKTSTNDPTAEDDNSLVIYRGDVGPTSCGKSPN